MSLDITLSFAWLFPHQCNLLALIVPTQSSTIRETFNNLVLTLNLGQVRQLNDLTHAQLLIIALCLTGVALLIVYIIRGYRANKFVTITITSPIQHSLTAHLNQTLLKAVNDQQLLIPSGCGGQGTCGQCLVNITNYHTPLTEQEKLTLTQQELANGYRLACQINPQQDLTICTPSAPSKSSELTAKVLSSQFKTPFIKELILQIDSLSEFSFRAGQYINIKIPVFSSVINKQELPATWISQWQHIEQSTLFINSHQCLQRSYSMASAMGESNQITLNIKLHLPRLGCALGRGSSYLFTTKIGDNIEFSGPFGDFCLNRDSTREVILIGAGSGIAPLKALAQESLGDRIQKISLWYGARQESDIIDKAFFDQLCRQQPNFQWHLCLSQPSASWSGLTGYIQDHLIKNYLQWHPALHNLDFYLCGPALLMQQTQQRLIALGVKTSQIKRDNFSPVTKKPHPQR